MASGSGIAHPLPAKRDMLPIPGGTFRMASDRHYPEEAPVRTVRVEAFWMDRTAVTNRQFARFVADTGYLSLAEWPLDPADYPGAIPDLMQPGVLAFSKPERPVDHRDMRDWWRYVPGASWRHPEGPGSTIKGRTDYPVVHVAHEDAPSFARWAGKGPPTEAEWEFGGRGGLDGAEYCWGDAFQPNGRWMANTWQGDFPHENTRDDGCERLAPVSALPPNGFGLHDMAVNVWGWTAAWCQARRTAEGCCVIDPQGGREDDSYDPRQSAVHILRKVVKGGSFLCAPNRCLRYRPARQPQMVDSAMSHLEFQCVLGEEKSMNPLVSERREEPDRPAGVDRRSMLMSGTGLAVASTLGAVLAGTAQPQQTNETAPNPATTAGRKPDIVVIFGETSASPTSARTGWA